MNEARRAQMRINAQESTLVFTSGEMYALGRCLMRKISVLLSEDEFALFQHYCDQQGHKKSTLVAKLIRDLLQHERVASQRPLFVSTEKSGRRTA